MNRRIRISGLPLFSLIKKVFLLKRDRCAAACAEQKLMKRAACHQMTILQYLRIFLHSICSGILLFSHRQVRRHEEAPARWR